MDSAAALSFAEAWIDAWNRRDVERVLRSYAPQVVFTSPMAERVVPGSRGIIRGKDALRAYWMRALGGNPELRFTLVGVSRGIDTIVITYENQAGTSVNEVLTFEDGLVVVGHATHAIRTP
jgi:ketosteroid isomerase-like protein